MREKFTLKLWVVAVFVALGVCLCMGCSTAKSYRFLGMQLPPVDVKNNATGQGSVLLPNPDGLPDQEFQDAVQGMKGTLNSATGGLLAPWLEISAAIAGVVALGFTTYNKIRGDIDHAKNVEEIKATDQNVATIAEKVGVPDSKLV